MHPVIKSWFSEYKLDAILITDILNIRWLTGFSGTHAYALITKRGRFFITDFRYLEQAKKQIAKTFTILDIKSGLTKIIQNKLGAKSLGIEAGHLTHLKFINLKKTLRGVKLVSIMDDPALVRIIKSDAEIKKITKALLINKLAFEQIRPLIKPGMTEMEIKTELECALLKNGAEKIAFDTIVASGWRGALPHGVATNKKIKKGELVTIDFGGIYQGYHADETVTVTTGKLSDKQKNIHQIVCEAQQAAIKIAKPGVKCADIDKAARDYITSKGYGKYFGHSLGHGVGLEIHEKPTLSPTSKDILKPGMVFTIEPGIYVPKFGGVRIEDVFVCTRTGVRRLSQINKKLNRV